MEDQLKVIICSYMKGKECPECINMYTVENFKRFIEPILTYNIAQWEGDVTDIRFLMKEVRV